MSVQAFRKSKCEELFQAENNRFKIPRLVKCLMPNRAGIHFDLDAYDCLAIDGTQVCKIGVTEDGYVAFPVSNDIPHHLGTLWLVSECDDDDLRKPSSHAWKDLLDSQPHHQSR
jgi:hypothetical protein